MKLEDSFCQIGSPSHLLGCDSLGNDLGLAVLNGAWHSIVTAVTVSFCAGTIGIFIGFLSVLSPKPFRFVALRFTDAVLAFPGVLLAIFIGAWMTDSEQMPRYVLIAVMWPAAATVTSATVAKALTSDYAEAAKALGASKWRLAFSHLLPNTLPIALVQYVFIAANAVLGEATLNYLGLGGSEASSWGRLIADGREYLVEAPHLSLVPGIALMVFLFSLHWFGRSLSAILGRESKEAI